MCSTSPFLNLRFRTAPARGRIHDDGEDIHASEGTDLRLSVPFPADARRAEIQFNGQAVYTAPISQHAPTVQITSLRPGLEPFTLHWTAADPDSQALAADILWSPDGGATFRPVLMDIRGTDAIIRPESIPGGRGLLRVRVTYGFHAGHADVPVEMPDQWPMPVESSGPAMSVGLLQRIQALRHAKS